MLTYGTVACYYKTVERATKSKHVFARNKAGFDPLQFGLISISMCMEV